MDRDQFDRLHRSRQVIHAFRALDVLGHLSFDPPAEDALARERTISLPDL